MAYLLYNFFKKLLAIMKYILALICFGFTAFNCLAQLDNQDASVRFESIENTPDETESFLNMPDIEAPSLTNPKKPNSSYSNLGEEDPDINFAKDDGLIDYKTDEQPKYFKKKDKPMLGGYFKDQKLGDVKTKGAYVTVMCRDHEFVDGDRIRIYANEDIVRGNLYLNSSFTPISIQLQDGINNIEFEALNQGSSGPNTAELHVYDEKGQIISAKEWNLGTGYKATFVVIKE